jgi:transcriptional regulator with XRE-family HTH domain
MHHLEHYIALVVNADQERVSAEMASRVRAERAHRRWTLDELAARSTVSRRLLVQIEHAEANPSLATLLKLAAALGVTLTEFLSEEPEARPVAVVSGEEAMTLWSTPAGSSARLLVSHGPLELWSWTLAAGDRRTSEPHRRGSLELLSVQTGTVAVDVGDHHVEIPTGDGAWFDATWPHAYINPGASAATFTLVVLEPA